MPRVGLTHCVHEHEYTPENTVWKYRKHRSRRTGKISSYYIRNCRECCNGHARTYRANLKKKEKSSGG